MLRGGGRQIHGPAHPAGDVNFVDFHIVDPGMVLQTRVNILYNKREWMKNKMDDKGEVSYQERA